MVPSRCRCSRASLALGALALALTANALSITNVFPYAPFMVKFFGLTDDERALGFYAGFFMTAYMIGNGASAMFWGYASDRIGKRAVIVLGLAANTLPQVIFGVATSMPTALALRLLMGVVGAAKALAPELVPPSEQASAMSMIAATWGLGNLIGPAVGGLLSQYHLCEGEEGEQPPPHCPSYPFLLPNAVCAAVSALGLLAVRRFLPNDKPAATATPAEQQEEVQAGEGDEVALRRAGAATASEAGGATEAAPGRRMLTRRSGALIAFYGL
jgi:MFS family permease